MKEPRKSASDPLSETQKPRSQARAPSTVRLAKLSVLLIEGCLFLTLRFSSSLSGFGLREAIANHILGDQAHLASDGVWLICMVCLLLGSAGHVEIQLRKLSIIPDLIEIPCLK